MNYKHVSACPRCGAPVYEQSDEKSGVVNLGGTVLYLAPPAAHFTCDCRKALAPPLPDDPMVEAESTEAADARYLASQRSEKPSEERAE